MILLAVMHRLFRIVAYTGAVLVIVLLSSSVTGSEGNELRLVSVLEHAIEIDSDHTNVNTKTQIATLSGNLEITQGQRKLTADTATFDLNTQTGVLIGDIVMQEPNTELKATALSISGDDSIEAQQAQVLIVDSNIRATGSTISRQSNGIIEITDATYTVCDPENETWKIHASHIKLDNEKGVGSAKNIRLDILGIPALYLPYLRFPVDDQRQSGLLFPSVSVSSDNGIDYTQPIYWNISPDKDIVIAPRWIQNRGVGVEAEARYLTDNTYSKGGFSVIFDDDTFANENRWLGLFEHNGQWGDINQPAGQWRTTASFQRVSDFNYFQDIDSALLAVDRTRERSYLQQSASIDYFKPLGQSGEIDISAGVSSFQRIQLIGGRQFETLPAVRFNVRYPLSKTWYIEALQNYHYFTRNDESLTQGHRQRLDYHLTYDINTLSGFFKARAGVKNLSYQVEGRLGNQFPVAIDTDNVNVGVVSVDTGLNLERSFNSNTVQTLQPRIYYVFSDVQQQQGLPIFDTAERTISYQQLFRDDRFNGLDRIGDSNQISLGLTSTLVDKQIGLEKLRLQVAQAYYFKDRQVNVFESQANLQRDYSELVLRADININRYWRLSGRANFSHSIASQPFQIEDADFRLSYHQSIQHSSPLVVSLAYSFERESLLFTERIEQVEVSLFWPISPQWQVFGMTQYDFFGERSLNSLAGFRYEGCCWALGLMYFQWIEFNATTQNNLERDEGVQLQFELKGLGGVGNSIEKVLKRRIFGYTARQ